jgi:NADP-dependent 3-hydroxy acid dehydrogenase YdfG
MPTIAIVGAGPGLGLAIARTFGAQGYDVALISRDAQKLDDLVGRLASEQITARAFRADVLDRPALANALTEAEQHFGAIDVLEYSPAAASTAPVAPVHIRQTTPENTQAQIEYYLYGAQTAAATVLPGMLARGTGTLLFTTGAGSINPVPFLGNVNAGAAALRNWAINLGQDLRAEGIHAAHVAIGVWIGDTAPEGFSSLTADEIAPRYWDLHQDRNTHEIVVTS